MYFPHNCTPAGPMRRGATRCEVQNILERSGDIQPADPCTDRQLAYMHVYQPQASLDRIYVRIVGSIVSWAHASVTACEKLIHIKCWPTVQPRKETFVWYTEYKSPNISLGGNQQRRRVHAAQQARHYPSCCLYKEPPGLSERGIRPHLHAVRLFLATRARSTSPSTTPTFSPRPAASQRPDVVFRREFLKPRRRKPPVERDGIHVLLHG